MYIFKLLCVALFFVCVACKAITDVIDDDRSTSGSSMQETTTGQTTRSDSTTASDEISRSVREAGPEIEIDESSTMTSDHEITTMKDMCMDQMELKKTVEKCLEKVIPDKVDLPMMMEGNQTMVMLENGFVKIGNNEILGDVGCREDSGQKKVDVFVQLNDLHGAVEWYLMKMLDHNYTESALISLNKLVTEMNFVETEADKWQLKSLKIGDMSKWKTEVNLPAEIAGDDDTNADMKFLKSKIKTMVGSMVKKSIADNFMQSMQNSISNNLDSMAKSKDVSKRSMDMDMTSTTKEMDAIESTTPAPQEVSN